MKHPATKLTQAYNEFTTPHTFKPGDLIQWKSLSLCNKALPEFNQPAVVVEVLETPLRDTSKSFGSAHAAESYDIIIGIIDSDGDFMTYFAESRRYQPALIPEVKDNEEGEW